MNLQYCFCFLLLIISIVIIIFTINNCTESDVKYMKVETNMDIKYYVIRKSLFKSPRTYLID